MRDAVGGTFMIYVLLIFLAVYICFVAVAFNYARAFRVKNKIIDIIEQNEGISDYENEDPASAMGQIETYLGNVNYNVSGIDKTTNACSEYEYVDEVRGYCINKVSNNNGNGSYYQVVTFVKLDIDILLLDWFEFTIPVKGETRKIERIST